MSVFDGLYIAIVSGALGFVVGFAVHDLHARRARRRRVHEVFDALREEWPTADWRMNDWRQVLQESEDDNDR